MAHSTTRQPGHQVAQTLDEFLRTRMRHLLEELLQEEVTATVGPARGSRATGRCGYRHGTRPRRLTLAAGTVEITVPRARLHAPDGTWTEWRSEVLPRRRRLSAAVEQAIVSTYLAGTNTRRIRAALQPLVGGGPLSKSAVSRLVQALTASFELWRRRELGADQIRYLYLDALYPKVRSAGRVVSLPILVAVGVKSTGEKVLLALHVSGSETGAAWADMVADLTARGLGAPQLVISDGNRGLKQALMRHWPGIPHQRCVVHKQRNIVSRAPKHVRAEVRREYHAIVYAPDRASAEAAQAHFLTRWGNRAPGAVTSLLEAADDLLTFHGFPPSQHRSLRSTNIIERLNGEFRRRLKTQSACPSEASALLLFFSLVASGQARLKKIVGWSDMMRPAVAA
jgi:putative transposase